MIHCGETPKCMLSKYSGKKKLGLKGTFGEIWHIQIQLFPQTSFEAKFGSSNLKN